MTKLTGYRRADFVARDGTKVTGYNVYLTSAIDPRRGSGMETERMYLSDAKIARENIVLADLLDKPVRVFYSRFGKIETLGAEDD